MHISKNSNPPQTFGARNKDNIMPFLKHHKSTIGAVASAGFGLASYVAPPPANAMLLGASRFLGGASALSYIKDTIDKAANKANDISSELKHSTTEVTTALGGNVLKPLIFDDITAKKRKNMSGTKPIMDKSTKKDWNAIIDWISLENKPEWGGKQNNYDCVYMYGPPGTGKTVFAKALFGAVHEKYALKLANITAGDLKERGAEKLNQLKQDAFELMDKATDKNPICIGFFLDEVEASLNKDRGLNPGVVNEYLTFINEIKDKAADNPNVYVLGALATNFDNQVDRASKRDGRVTRNLHIDFPTLEVKKQIVPYAVKQLELKPGIQKTLTDALENNPQVNTSLNEHYLVGASIVEAMKKTQQQMALQNPTLSMEDIISKLQNEFANTFAEHLKKSAENATLQRQADEAELKAKQALESQLARMAEALEGISKVSETTPTFLQNMVQQLQEIAQKTGDNTALERIIQDMGRKFQEMQNASNSDRQAIINQLKDFIKQIQIYSQDASQSAQQAGQSSTRAQNSATEAKNSETNASHARWAAYDAAKSAVQNTLSQLETLKGQVSFLEKQYSNIRKWGRG